MKSLKAFIKKEFFHILRDPRTLIVLFGIPIIQMIIFGYAISNDVKNIKIGVVDKSNDELTRKIISKISFSKFFQMTAVLSSENEINDYFKKGEIKEFIVFEPHFSEKILRYNKADVQLITDASDPNTANLIVNYTTMMVNTISSEIVKQPDNKVPVNVEVDMLYNPTLEASWMFVPGIIALILTLISVMLTSVSITREKELGSMELLLVTPLKPITIISGKVFPYFILSLLNISIIFFMGYILFGVPVKGSIILLYTLSILYIILSLSVGIFISTIANNQQTAMFSSLVALMLPTILLSGFIFPVENMPVLLQYLSVIMPPKYFIEALRGIMLKGNGFFQLWKDFLVIAVMIVFFMTVSVKKYKSRLM